MKKSCSMQKKIESFFKKNEASGIIDYPGTIEYNIFEILQDGHKINNPTQGITYKSASDLYDAIYTICGKNATKLVVTRAYNESDIEGIVRVQCTCNGSVWEFGISVYLVNYFSPVKDALKDLNLKYSGNLE